MISSINQDKDFKIAEIETESNNLKNEIQLLKLELEKK